MEGAEELNSRFIPQHNIFKNIYQYISILTKKEKMIFIYMNTVDMAIKSNVTRQRETLRNKYKTKEEREL